MLQYLRSVAPGQQPFFLVVSLVNPHDVLAYPRIWQDGGYDSDAWLDGEIGLPLDRRRGPLDETGGPAAVQRLVEPGSRPAARRGGATQLRQLLRQSHQSGRRRPGRGAGHPGGDRAARRHADRPHLRPRRDGDGARRHAAEELQRLRGIAARAARYTIGSPSSGATVNSQRIGVSVSSVVARPPYPHLYTQPFQREPLVLIRHGLDIRVDRAAQSARSSTRASSAARSAICRRICSRSRPPPPSAQQALSVPRVRARRPHRR